MIPYFSLSWLLLIFALSANTVYAAPDVSTELQFHADGPGFVQGLNSGAKPYSITIATVDLLLSKLNKRPKFLVVPFARSEQFIAKGESICVANKVKNPERQAKYLLSLPLNFYQTHRLYGWSNQPPVNPVFLTKQGKIKNIHNVINSLPTAKILIPSQYAYGKQLDEDIQQIDKSHIIPIANHDHYASFMGMFKAKRADFALIFPAALYAQYENAPPRDLNSYAIAGVPGFIGGHFLCSKTPQAKRFVNWVNDELLKLYSQPAFIDAHTRYLPKKSAPELKKYIQDYARQITTKWR